MSPYEKHKTESSCVPILWLPGNYEWELYGCSTKWMRGNQILYTSSPSGSKEGTALSLQARRYAYESHEATERATVVSESCRNFKGRDACLFLEEAASRCSGLS